MQAASLANREGEQQWADYDRLLADPEIPVIAAELGVQETPRTAVSVAQDDS
jgi:hypothetical protein